MCNFGFIKTIPDSCDDKVDIFNQYYHFMLSWFSVFYFSSVSKLKDHMCDFGSIKDIPDSDDEMLDFLPKILIVC